MRFLRQPKIYILFVLILVGSYFVITLARSSDTVIPAQFTSSRLEGALIAQEIVDLSNKSSESVKAINDLDKEGNFSAALDLTSEVISQSVEIRNQAVELSNRLEGMTLALPGIKSLPAREAAFEAINNYLVLIGRLVNYSNYLGELSEVLKDKFSGDFSAGNKVPFLVANINREVNEINNLNEQAKAAIEKFDKLTR